MKTRNKRLHRAVSERMKRGGEPFTTARRAVLKEIEAEKRCSFCEYFDGGGLARVLEAREKGAELGGDCLNSRSPRLQTTSLGTCEHFYPGTDGRTT
jgi:hypothetical protein